MAEHGVGGKLCKRMVGLVAVHAFERERNPVRLRKEKRLLGEAFPCHAVENLPIPLAHGADERADPRFGADRQVFLLKIAVDHAAVYVAGRVDQKLRAKRAVQKRFRIPVAVLRFLKPERFETVEAYNMLEKRFFFRIHVQQILPRRLTVHRKTQYTVYSQN